MFMKKAQGAIEYVLLLGAVLFLVIMVVVITKGNILFGGGETTKANFEQLTTTLDNMCDIGIPCPSGYTCLSNGSCALAPAPSCSALTCGDTVLLAGSYCVNSDLVGAGSCITVNASDVEIDCQGHLITGPSAVCPPTFQAGVVTNEAITNLTVKNCRITNYCAGILAGGPFGGSLSNGNLSNNEVYGCYGGIGVAIQDSVFTDNNASYNTFGIELTSNGNALDNNIACGNFNGADYDDFFFGIGQTSNTNSVCDYNGCYQDVKSGLCDPNVAASYGNCTSVC